MLGVRSWDVLVIPAMSTPPQGMKDSQLRDRKLRNAGPLPLLLSLRSLLYSCPVGLWPSAFPLGGPCSLSLSLMPTPTKLNPSRSVHLTTFHSFLRQNLIASPMSLTIY